jgi:hypothetical protein
MNQSLIFQRCRLQGYIGVHDCSAMSGKLPRNLERLRRLGKGADCRPPQNFEKASFHWHRCLLFEAKLTCTFADIFISCGAVSHSTITLSLPGIVCFGWAAASGQRQIRSARPRRAWSALLSPMRQVRCDARRALITFGRGWCRRLCGRAVRRQPACSMLQLSLSGIRLTLALAVSRNQLFNKIHQYGYTAVYSTERW